jgi:hypothetical protein
MPRPRKPTQLLVVEGNLRPGRHAERALEPVVDIPLGGPPRGWKPDGKALWWEIANAIPANVATKADRLIVELTCRLVGVMRKEPANFTSAIAAQLRCCLASLGLTPADRSRVSVRTKSSDPEMDEWFT